VALLTSLQLSSMRFELDTWMLVCYKSKLLPPSYYTIVYCIILNFSENGCWTTLFDYVKKLYYLIRYCRGDFQKSSYWLALTHNFLIHDRALIFPSERGKKFEITHNF